MNCETLPITAHMERPKPILVVDDDPLFRGLMAGVLKTAYSVAVASDGANAFYQSLDNVPVIAVIDIQMPGWDGLKTLRAFRTHPLLANVKIIVLSSDASRETILAAIAAGADDYIIKTAFSKDELRRKMERLLESSAVDGVTRKKVTESTSRSAHSRPSNGLSALPADSTSPSEKRNTPILATSEANSDGLLQEAIDAWD